MFAGVGRGVNTVRPSARCPLLWCPLSLLVSASHHGQCHSVLQDRTPRLAGVYKFVTGNVSGRKSTRFTENVYR